MNGEEAINNLLAIANIGKFESWFDEIMQTALDYAVETIAEKEGLDVEEIRSA